jgi:tetratricopeptide (TPR) repeat protein
MYQRALVRKEKALSAEHTSTIDSVHCLRILYANQGKLVEAEQMYQQALQSYKKAIGPDLISSYVPALNTTFNLGLLFEHQANIATAKTMFLKALCGYEQVFRPDHAKSESVQNKLCALDAMLETKALIKIEELTDDPLTGSSHPGINKPPSTSKRHKLF